MMRCIFGAFALLFCSSAVMAQDESMGWSTTDIAVLNRWAAAAPLDALPMVSTRSLEQALTAGDSARADDEATMLALRLARMHLLGSAGASERAGWNIVDTDRDLALEPILAQAVANDTLDTFFAGLRPAHEEYAALKSAYGQELDEQRRQTIARNMERWRWMPRSLGQEYVLVNSARFEAYLWRDGVKAGTWRVIVGKKTTPTPVFDTRITGATLNPWWEIPTSIVRESVGALVRRSPATARARGYVWSDGRYRQRPGPGNALGQMKLAMANPYSVYMHDTPNKQLFDQPVRAYSHGCIRTDDAIGYAAKLLEETMSREQVDAIVASGKTTTVSLLHPVPIYIAYFTAASDGAGGVAVLPDIYGRDSRIHIAATETECSAT